MKKKDDPIVVFVSMIGWGIIVVSLIILGFMLGNGRESFNEITTGLLLTTMLPINAVAVLILGFARIIEILNEINDKL